MKLTNPLILALDTEPSQAKKVCKSLKKQVQITKIGGRLFTALGPGIVKFVRKQKQEVFLDLKFHDIPKTVAESCRNAVHLKVWGLTIHTSGGFAMMKEAKDAVVEESKKLGVRRPLIFGVTVLTSLSNSDLKEVGIGTVSLQQVKRLALLAKKAGLDGVVASGNELEILRRACGRNFLFAVPGIRFNEPGSYGDQKRVVTPAQAKEFGADYFIVGRPILEAKNKKDAIKKILSEVMSA